MSEVLTVNLHGAPYQVEDPGGIIGNCLRDGKPYEQAVLSHIRETYSRRRGMARLAIDVGAGIGNHSLWLAAVCGFRVYAFEPVEFERFRRNLDLNPGLDIELAPVAAGAFLGRTAVTPAPRNVDAHAGEAGQVPCIPIDAIGLAPTLIKIDVEGMEPEVLRGARDTIEQHRPRLFVEAMNRQARKSNRGEIPRGYVHVKTWGATPLEEFVWVG